MKLEKQKNIIRIYLKIDWANIAEIKKWSQNHNYIDAILWTNLPEKLNPINPDPQQVTDAEIVQYLNTLPPHKKEKARQYIQNVPKEIDTRLRRMIGNELGW